MWLQSNHAADVGRDYALRFDGSSGVMNYDYAGTSVCSQSTRAKFTRVDGQGCEAMVQLMQYGSHDYILQASTGLVATFCLRTGCSGTCYAECDPDGDPNDLPECTCATTNLMSGCGTILGDDKNIHSSSVMTIFE